MHGEVVRPCATQTPDVPGIEQLGFGDRHEEVAGLRLPVRQQSGLAVLNDLGVRGHP